MSLKIKTSLFISFVLLFTYALAVKAEDSAGEGNSTAGKTSSVHPTTVTNEGSNISPTAYVPREKYKDPRKKPNLNGLLVDERKKMQEKLEQEKMKFREVMDLRRKEASQSFELKREEFKQKLQLIKDERKKTITERINNRLSEINKNRTNRMMDSLSRLSEILGKLSNKVSEAKANGKDTSAAEAAIVQANNAISAAQNAVSNQAGKVYIAQITTEANLRTSVGQSISQIENDLKTVHKLILDAKQAVMNVVREMAKLGIVPLKVGEHVSVSPPVSTMSPTVIQTLSPTEPVASISATQ